MSKDDYAPGLVSFHSPRPCPWPGCQNQATKRWACEGHWYRLPRQLQIRIERLRDRSPDDPELNDAEREAFAWMEANKRPVGGSPGQRHRRTGAAHRYRGG